MKSGRRMKKTKNNTKIMKKLAIFIIILCIAFITINNKENIIKNITKRIEQKKMKILKNKRKIQIIK